MTLDVQLAVVRPRLARRSDAVLTAPAVPPGSGESGGLPRRSRAHYGYVGLEVMKAVALIAAGAALLAA